MREEELRQSCYSMAVLRQRAQQVLPRVVFDFVDGGAEDEVTLRRNEAAFHEIALLPKALSGTTARDQSVDLFGERIPSRVIIGPTGMAGLLWPQGELAAARAAARAGTVYVTSHGSTCTLEAIGAATPATKWMQVFIYRDRAVTRSFVERAHQAGYRALVLTIDNQVLGGRERDIRNGFTVPLRPSLAGGIDMLMHLPWVLRRARHPRVTFANYATSGRESVQSLGAYMASLLDPSVSWRDFRWLRQLWHGPLLIKGILHPAEAVEAVARGADGIIVSNHGGRQLDGALSSIEALPAIADAVGNRVPVLIDGGIRRGADVVKAVALGATACLIGRPHLWGLAVAGEAGVDWVLELYRREVDRVLALGGWDGLAAVDRGAVHSWVDAPEAGGHHP
jgi:isopentenyl diphosphate isomerase/L-lactate dehydrogenase-like FMN-dependent dehydrogenase